MQMSVLSIGTPHLMCFNRKNTPPQRVLLQKQSSALDWYNWRYSQNRKIFGILFLVFHFIPIDPGKRRISNQQLIKSGNILKFILKSMLKFTIVKTFMEINRIAILRAWSQYFAKRRLKLWGRLETSKMVGFGWNFTLVPWVNTWGVFFNFWKFLILRAWSQYFAKRRLKL